MYLTNKLIKRAVKRYKDADLCIFTNFDFYNKFNSIPTLLFCDWTYQILIQDHLDRAPYFFEKKFPLWQREAIEHADCVVSLFPVCADLMKKTYPKANIHYVGGNVVNSLYGKPHDVDQFIDTKEKSNDLLFIGGSKYKDGAKLLIEAFQILKKTNKGLHLHIVGMKENDFHKLPDNVSCHGYLRKDNPAECELYYRLLIGAKLIVNPTKVWAGYSSTIEAMYFATPIVVSPYKDFVEEFGESIDFGRYNDEYTAEGLAETIRSVFMDKDYSTMCRNAYDRVKSYTWSAYVDKILDLL